MDIKKINSQYQNDRENNYKKIYKWAFSVGKELKDKNEEKLGWILIFDLRAEYTPGRFFRKLATRLVDFNKRVEGFNKTLPFNFLQFKSGDKFHYVASAILIGIMNGVCYKSSTTKTQNENKS